MANNGAKLAVMVLAGGGSSRLGQPKQLVAFEGETLIARQCRHALTLTDKVYCVLGCQAEQMAEELRGLAVTPVLNKHWQQGMSSSIAAGVSVLAEDIDAVMIVLVDQWQLNPDLLHQFCQNWQGDPDTIVLAGASPNPNNGKGNGNNTEQMKKGPPVIFPRRYFAELRALTGEQGARPLLALYPQYLELVELPLAFIDLDTPEQLAQLDASQLTSAGKS